ncbi:MAG: pectate lyase [Gemmatimonadota bacterium]
MSLLGAFLVSGALAACDSAVAEWATYRARSRADYARDSASMAAELRARGMRRWTTPPVAKDFRLSPAMTPAWFRGDDASRIGATILSFQTPSGGWSKHVDMFGPPRKAGESYYSESAAWNYIATIDNGATVTQLEFLRRALAVRQDTAWQDAFARGIAYLLRAQHPGGGWPQVYPLQGGYHDATTYNDDAIVGVLQLLRAVGTDAARGSLGWLDVRLQRDAAAAFDRGVAGILADQHRVNGSLTVWGQQHDPCTRAPAAARSYELSGLTGGESAGILEFLMSVEGRAPALQRGVERAVHAGIAWLRAHEVRGVRYDSTTGSFVRDPQAPPTWARVYEIPGFRPVMANRDGVPRYDVAELTDRRTGYAWFIQRPASALRQYAAWSSRHPRQER